MATYNCMSMHALNVTTYSYCIHILIQNFLETYPLHESNRRYGSTHSLDMPGMYKSESMRSLQKHLEEKESQDNHL